MPKYLFKDSLFDMIVIFKCFFASISVVDIMISSTDLEELSGEYVKNRVMSYEL